MLEHPEPELIFYLSPPNVTSTARLISSLFKSIVLRGHANHSWTALECPVSIFHEESCDSDVAFFDVVELSDTNRRISNPGYLTDIIFSKAAPKHRN